MAYFVAELQMMASADVFCGTYSSNVGRLVVLLREAMAMPRDSALSCDKPDWFAGRQLSRGDVNFT